MGAGAYSVDQLMELAGLAVSQAGKHCAIETGQFSYPDMSSGERGLEANIE